MQTNLGQKFVWTPNLYLDDLFFSSVNTTYPADFVTSYIVKMGNVGFFGEFKNFKMATISCSMSLFFWCTGVALAIRVSPRVLYCMEGEFEKIITNFEWALRTTITNCGVRFIAFYLTYDQMLGKKDRQVAGYFLFGISYPIREESWMRSGQQTRPFTMYFNMWTVSSDVSTQRRHWQPLSVHLWAYCTHPTHDVNEVMCVG